MTHRYLPKEAWEHLTPEQAAETDAVKTASDAQFVPNTEAARHAGHAAREPLPDYDSLTVAQVVAAVRERPQAAERVREYEQAHKARKGVLGRLPV